MPVAFHTVVEKITEAARQVDADDGASPVLVAVVHEFRSKLAKAESLGIPIISPDEFATMVGPFIT